MASNITYDGVNGAEGGNLFQSMSFWVAQRVPTRNTLLDGIRNNGGTIVPLEKDATMLIADHARKDAPKGAFSWKFIDDSLKNGARQIEDKYRIGPDPNEPRPVAGRGLTKKGRAPYTHGQIAALVKYVLSKPGASRQGNELFQKWEQIDPAHTWQSWRNKWVKDLQHRTPHDLKMLAATAPSDPAPPETSSTPNAALRQVQTQPTAPAVARPHPSAPPPVRPRATSAKGETAPWRNEFTDEDDAIIALWIVSNDMMGDKALFMQLADEHPHHSWESWKNRYHKKIKFYDNKTLQQMAEQVPDEACPGGSSQQQIDAQLAESTTARVSAKAQRPTSTAPAIISAAKPPGVNQRTLKKRQLVDEKVKPVTNYVSSTQVRAGGSSTSTSRTPSAAPAASMVVGHNVQAVQPSLSTTPAQPQQQQSTVVVKSEPKVGNIQGEESDDEEDAFEEMLSTKAPPQPEEGNDERLPSSEGEAMPDADEDEGDVEGEVEEEEEEEEENPQKDQFYRDLIAFHDTTIDDFDYPVLKGPDGDIDIDLFDLAITYDAQELAAGYEPDWIKAAQDLGWDPEEQAWIPAELERVFQEHLNNFLEGLNRPTFSQPIVQAQVEEATLRLIEAEAEEQDEPIGEEPQGSEAEEQLRDGQQEPEEVEQQVDDEGESGAIETQGLVTHAGSSPPTRFSSPKRRRESDHISSTASVRKRRRLRGVEVPSTPDDVVGVSKALRQEADLSPSPSLRRDSAQPSQQLPILQRTPVKPVLRHISPSGPDVWGDNDVLRGRREQATSDEDEELPSIGAMIKSNGNAPARRVPKKRSLPSNFLRPSSPAQTLPPSLPEDSHLESLAHKDSHSHKRSRRTLPANFTLPGPSRTQPPSSPHLELSSPQRQPSQSPSQTGHLPPDEDSGPLESVTDWLDRHLRIGYPKHLLHRALHHTTLTTGPALEHVLDSLSNENGVPTDLPGVWLPSEDDTIKALMEVDLSAQVSSAKMLIEQKQLREEQRRLIARHTFGGLSARKKYLRKRMEKEGGKWPVVQRERSVNREKVERKVSQGSAWTQEEKKRREEELRKLLE